MGDIVSLVEKAAENIDKEEMEDMAKKIAKGKFDLEDFANQLKQMGLSIDWSREIATCDKLYYQNQQKLFLKFYRKKFNLQKKSLL